MDNEIHLCPGNLGGCGGCGLNMNHPKILDIKAGKYTDEHTCPICKGSGYDPRRHPDKVLAHTSNKV